MGAKIGIKNVKTIKKTVKILSLMKLIIDIKMPLKVFLKMTNTE